MAKPLPPLEPTPWSQRWATKNPPADPSTSFAGKTILVTGANSGIGLEAAMKFAKLGASKIIFGVRSLERGAEAKANIEKETGCDPNVIELFQLDMESQTSVKKFANQVSAKYPQIHVVLLNAGVFPATYEQTEDGWERAAQVQVISTAQLALLLLPRLKETGIATGTSAHLNVVTSNGYFLAKIESFKTTGNILESLNNAARFKLAVQYFESKLLQMWVMDHIASKVRPDQVIVTTCCPGLCKTNYQRDVTGIMKYVMKLHHYLCARTAEQGGRTLVSAALLGMEAHGKFWTNDHAFEPGPLVKSDEAMKLSDKCWNEVLEVVKKQDPELDLGEFI